MAGIIDIKKDLLDTTVSELKSTASNVISTQANIKSSTEALLSGWKGKSRNAFAEEYNVLNANLGQYNEILLDMANILSNVKLKFEESDQMLSNNMK